MALMEDMLDRGHIVYTDRYYSSIPLAEALCSRDTGLVGTLVRNRKGLPQEVRGSAFKLSANEVKAWRSEKNLVVAWRHEKKACCHACHDIFCVTNTNSHRAKEDPYHETRGSGTLQQCHGWCRPGRQIQCVLQFYPSVGEVVT